MLVITYRFSLKKKILKVIGVESPSFFLVMESGTVGISYSNYFDIKKVDHEKASVFEVKREKVIAELK